MEGKPAEILHFSLNLTKNNCYSIVGFTAWSSVHEPSQVFVLLETLYMSFDKAAKARRIFKIETVGDCYVSTVHVVMRSTLDLGH